MCFYFGHKKERVKFVKMKKKWKWLLGGRISTKKLGIVLTREIGMLKGFTVFFVLFRCKNGNE